MKLVFLPHGGVSAVQMDRDAQGCFARVQLKRLEASSAQLLASAPVLGGTGRQRVLLERGVTRVVASGRTLKVTLLDGEVTLYSSGHERMLIYEQ